MEILHAGREAEEPLPVTLVRMRRAYPSITDEGFEAEVRAYSAWLRERIRMQQVLLRELQEMGRRKKAAPVRIPAA
jgi:hypothetical protein